MRVTIENVPPIASGSFELRPLTIFIGPNNTGKTRAGLLAYALAKALDEPFRSGMFPQWPASYVQESSATYDNQPDRIVESLTTHANRILGEALPQLVEALLGRSTTSQITGALSVRFETKSSSSISIGSRFDPASEANPFADTVRLAQAWDAFSNHAERSTPLSAGQMGEPLDSAFWRWLRKSHEYPSGSAHYLPAGRGAFAASWGFLTGVALERFGENGSASTLPQFVRDYLRLLLNAAYLYAIAKPGPFALYDAVDLIEREILKGRVTASGNPSVPFPLVYSNVFAEDEDRYTIDLSRASSSINEVGAMSIILGSVVKPNDLVIIDEPESHLHPENQRRIARVLVRLAKAGVTVVAPTHSHTIIHEVSDVIRGGRLEKTKRERLGYNDSDRISPDDVGVYVFRDQGTGVTINEIEFDEEFGYPEETFYEVAHEQSLASHRIDLASVPAAVE
jgi:hypothetical protein